MSAFGAHTAEVICEWYQRASPIRGPEDIRRECDTFITHSLRIRPKRMFKTYPVTMEFTHVIGSGGFAVCDLATLGSSKSLSYPSYIRQLDGMRAVVKRTPKAKCPDGSPQREVGILRLFDAESAQNYFLRFFFSLERHDEILMVTEYIEGGNLASFYANNLECISDDMTRYFLAQLAVAIGILHQRFNVIHRDIKPENVCLTRDGVVKILDFGLAVEGPTCDLKGGTPRYQNKAMRLGERHSYEVRETKGISVLIRHLVRAGVVALVQLVPRSVIAQSGHLKKSSQEFKIVGHADNATNPTDSSTSTIPCRPIGTPSAPPPSSSSQAASLRRSTRGSTRWIGRRSRPKTSGSSWRSSSGR